MAKYTGNELIENEENWIADLIDLGGMEFEAERKALIAEGLIEDSGEDWSPFLDCKDHAKHHKTLTQR